MLGGVVIGGGAGALAGQQPSKPTPPPPPPPEPEFNRSYAQQGEDLVVGCILRDLKIDNKARFLDIGAHDPVRGNNTYLFYTAGYRGVLVEPNPYYVDLIKKRRPEDIVLPVGIGVDDQREADYYVIRGDGQLNTFSKEQAEAHEKESKGAIQRVEKRELVRLDKVLEQHFAAAAPGFVSMDIEGLDLAILKTLDFERWRPPVFCIETAAVTGDIEEGIAALLSEKGYVIRGGSPVNTVFVDKKRLDGHGHHHG